MLDVLPPGRIQPKKPKAQRPSVVEINWRLPARLRRPISQELQRQRQKKRQRDAIVGFERRPLYAPGLSHDSRSIAQFRHNVGAEHHTGDVYRERRPLLSASVPPYAGSFLRGKTRPRDPTHRTIGVKTAHRSAVLPSERDVPYKWQIKTPVVVKPAPAPAVVRRSQFAMPIHLSVWPFKKKNAETMVTDKKKVQNSDSQTF